MKTCTVNRLFLKKQIFYILLTFLLLILPKYSISSLPEWQQRVNYNIDVTLVDSIRTFQGAAEITYINNSPHTLGTLWFRLPPDARRGGSCVDQTLYRGRKHRFKTVPEENWGKLTVDSVFATGIDAVFEQDHSIGQLHLDPPISPGDSARFTMHFQTRFPGPGAASRIAYDSGQYKGAYWYPMICPYTPEYGWTVNRYFGTAEAYGEFGDFTLRYTVPNRYIVASTGYLVNEDEVLPRERLEGLSISNPEPDPIPTGEEGERPVSWIYQADNVPDVAFVAGERFLIDRFDYGNFESWAFVKRGREEKWSDAAEVCGWTVQQLEDIYGEYPWPRVYAVDANSAMEYPMLTMMSWETPWYRYVMMHEIIHNYTPMIIHSNSVDAPVLDEGFTTFIEHELSERYEKTTRTRKKTYTRGVFTRDFVEHDYISRGIRPYLESVLDETDLPMVRGSDIAEDYWQLRVSTYYKTPVMLNALRSVIGEDAFWRGFRIYYRDNKFSHVDENDMIEAFEEAAGQPLGWFFKQFLYGNGDVDYSISDYQIPKTDKSTEIEFTVERHGEVRLPVRLAVVLATGDTLRGEIPFLPTDQELDGFERWGYWDQLHDPAKNYTISVDPGFKTESIILDPDNRYSDSYPVNNRRPYSQVDLKFDIGIWPLEKPPIDRYQIRYGPIFGYGNTSGTMGGVKLRRDYLGRGNRWGFDILIPENSETEILNLRAGLAQPIWEGPYRPQFFLRCGKMHGDWWANGGIHRLWRPASHEFTQHEFTLQLGVLNREEDEYYPFTNYYLTFEDEVKSYVSVSYDLRKNRRNHAINNKYAFISGYSRVIGNNNYSEGRGYTTFEWELSQNINIWKKLLLMLEFRFVMLSQSTPAEFRPTLQAGAPLRLLGDPLFSAPWYRDNSYPAFPLPNTYGALVSTGRNYSPDRFFIYRIGVRKSLKSLFKIQLGGPIGRFIGKIHPGIQHATGFVSTGSGSNPLEFGPTLELIDFYGLTVSSRWAPWHGDLTRNDGIKLYNPGNWTWEDWASNAVILVSLDKDILFR